MQKQDMREWVSSLETLIDKKLRKWRKENRIENGEVVQLRWQFEQIHFHMDIFWHDGEETVILSYLSPRITHAYTWHKLNDKTLQNIEDRVGNLAQTAMYSYNDPDH